jgi:hypothetical protein
MLIGKFHEHVVVSLDVVDTAIDGVSIPIWRLTNGNMLAI